nr:hypothetical protein [uncultured Campylobacter sp.]
MKFKNPLRAAKPVAERRAAILEGGNMRVKFSVFDGGRARSMFYCGASQAARESSFCQQSAPRSPYFYSVIPSRRASRRL